ncbi:MAG: undecaprenyl-diphosphate phosphatase [Actinobacteria bacterium]|uniref:Undecaprenyl-diphosphatase n=1 Tax=freshwater metagenome TaxID=449393 RepID=A0A6J6XXJ6_9ZZZZ|nr:undecaprenyl-diphosphate phosphatase [Actinomycetota bacterium]
MSYLEAIFLGVLQGLTEFLPISSSAHLAIFPQLFGFDDPGASFTAVTQIGTEVAVLLFFWRDIVRIIKAWAIALVRKDRRGDLDARMGWYIIVGTLPIAVVGFLFQDTIKTTFRSLWLIAIMLIVFGLILGIADRINVGEKLEGDLTLKDSLLYGLGQMLALIPGVSRSGATISVGLFRGYRRDVATRYAFLLAIPAVLASGVSQLNDVSLAASPASPGLPKTLVATLVAFVVGYVTIGWLLKYLRTRSYLPFVVYRVALGSLVLILLATGVLDSAVSA